MIELNGNNADSPLLKSVAAILKNIHFDKPNKALSKEIILFRHDNPIEIEPCIYEPSIALILQGKKRVSYAGNTIEYGAGTFLLTSMDLPVSSEITEASSDKPYLSILFPLNMKTVFSLLQEHPSLGMQQENYDPLAVCYADEKLLGAFLRLLEVDKDTGLAAMLTPLIHSEIIIRLLAGPEGQHLRAVLQNSTSVYKIANAVNWFKDNYSESITMDELASKVHMNASTFRQLFKKVTAMSPLQYLKTIRLQNARNLMLREDIDAASAAIRVGYESVSQFSREYKRYFGLPPKQDVKSLRVSLRI